MRWKNARKSQNIIDLRGAPRYEETSFHFSSWWNSLFGSSMIATDLTFAVAPRLAVCRQAALALGWTEQQADAQGMKFVISVLPGDKPQNGHPTEVITMIGNGDDGDLIISASSQATLDWGSPEEHVILLVRSLILFLGPPIWTNGLPYVPPWI